MSLDPEIFRRVERGRATAEDYRALAQHHRELRAAATALRERFCDGKLDTTDEVTIGRMLAADAEAHERVAVGYSEQSELADLRAAKAGTVAP